RLGGSPPRRDLCSGAAYRDRSKLEVLLGPGIWRDCADKVVLDFGCGTGDDAVEIAQRGARRVIGLDIRESVLEVARQRAPEVDGGLNGMTVRRFSRLVAESGYAVEQFEAVPIRKLSFLAAGPTRELFTAIIRCRLSAA